MNFTSVEKKEIIKTENKVKQIEPNKIENSKNLNIKKIEPKKFGIKNIKGNINPVIQNNRNQNSTISLAAKLSDISEQLEKYENLINKLGKDFQ